MNNQIENTARVLKVLGDPNRLGIVFAIGKESRSVTELIKMTGLSQTLVSFHLRALRKAEIVRTRRDGPFIYYSLRDPGLMDILSDLCRLTESGTEAEKPSRQHTTVEMAGKGGK
jgi:DNA-binding transcriptional ArsR family regulator